LKHRYVRISPSQEKMNTKRKNKNLATASADAIVLR